MYLITKEFEFCYGHRVHNQTLNTEYSVDGNCACRHLHGHQGKVVVHLSEKQLTNDMVTDFKHLNWFKKWLEDNLDHKMILDEKDPLTHLLTNDLTDVAKWYEEIAKGLIFVPFNPTSERMAKWMFDMIADKMSKIGVQCVQVDFWETPKSKSSYIHGQH